jgi:DNA-directed RNA polymerase subunit RPC12/RpoP
MRTKKAVGKRKKSTLKQYVCSSPTCAKTFEKPKIVRYYACPYCLSKIEKTTSAKNQLVPPKEPAESPIESRPVTEEKRKRAETVKPKISILPESVEGPEAVEPHILIAVPKSVEIHEKIDSMQTEDKQCKYYFGYLQNREKGEGIPEACVECPKSVDCMLSNLCQSQTAVSEIKKWYNIF